MKSCGKLFYVKECEFLGIQSELFMNLVSTRLAAFVNGLSSLKRQTLAEEIKKIIRLEILPISFSDVKKLVRQRFFWAHMQNAYSKIVQVVPFGKRTPKQFFNDLLSFCKQKAFSTTVVGMERTRHVTHRQQKAKFIKTYFGFISYATHTKSLYPFSASHASLNRRTKLSGSNNLPTTIQMLPSVCHCVRKSFSDEKETKIWLQDEAWPTLRRPRKRPSIKIN